MDFSFVVLSHFYVFQRVCTNVPLQPQKKVHVNISMAKFACTWDSNERNDFCVELEIYHHAVN